MPQNRTPPSTQRAYDVCVVGSQLGGIAAGALLARRGFRVLHVDHDGLGGHYEDHGWLLPHAPALLPSPRNLPASEAVLSELGLTPDLGRQLEACIPDLQLLLPRHRLDLSRDLEAHAERVRNAAPRAWRGPADEAALHLLSCWVTEACLSFREWAEGARLTRADLGRAVDLAERRLFRATLR